MSATSDLAMAKANERAASASEWRALVAIAVPVVVVQVGMMLMGTVDTLMVGHVSANALASVALGNLYSFNVLVIAMGTLMALDPLVAQAVGASDHAGIMRSMQRGMIVALLLGAAAMLGMIPAAGVLRLFRQPAELVPDAARWVRIGVMGLWPFLFFVVLRQSLQAIGRLTPVVLTIVAANALNVALNWIFIFGHLGAPALGVAGSAISTLVSRWTMFVMLLVLSWRELRPHLAAIDPASFARAPLWRMLGLGLPIGVQQFLEVSAFNAVGLLMGTFGALLVASHQVALNLAALTFMVP